MIFTYHMTNIWNTFSRLCLQRLPENKSMSVSEPCVSNGRLGHLANSVVFIWKLCCHWVRRSGPEAVSYQYRNSHYNGEYLHLGCQSDEHLVGCQPDEPLASLVTSEKIINVYGFLVVIMLRMHCLYFIGNEITTTTITTGKTLYLDWDGALIAHSIEAAMDITDHCVVRASPDMLYIYHWIWSNMFAGI